MSKLGKLKAMLNTTRFKEFKDKKVAVYLGVVVIVLIGIILAITNRKPDLSKLETEAEKYYFQEQYDVAIEKYSELVKKDKLSPKWNIKIAEVYSLKGDLANSLKYIEFAKKYEAIDVEVYNHMIFTEFMNRDYVGAVRDGEIAVGKYPKDKQLIKTMFAIYMANNKLDKAKDIISVYPVDIKSAYDTAEYSRMLMLVGRWGEAYTELRNAWEIDKDEYKIYDVLAQISVYNKDSLLQNVIALSRKHPNDLVYKIWLAKIYSLSDDTIDVAKALVEELEGKDVGNIEIKLIKASVYQSMGQAEKSDKLIEDIISQYQDDYRAFHSAGWYYLHKKDYDKAIEYCNKSIEKNKDYPDNYGFLMPEILKQHKEKLGGEPYFRTALLKEPYNYNIMLNLANYYWYTTNDNEKALDYFKLAAIIKPQDADIKYNMALINLANDKQDEAIKILKECIKLNEVIPKYHRTLSTVYMMKNQSVEAKVEIQNAYHADEEDILTLNNAGCYYITIEQNIDRGFYNITKAYEGLNDSYDDYTKKVIVENYDKAVKLKESYYKGKDNEVLKIPEFILFY